MSHVYSFYTIDKSQLDHATFRPLRRALELYCRILRRIGIIRAAHCNRKAPRIRAGEADTKAAFVEGIAKKQGRLLRGSKKVGPEEVGSRGGFGK